MLKSYRNKKNKKNSIFKNFTQISEIVTLLVIFEINILPYSNKTDLVVNHKV